MQYFDTKGIPWGSFGVPRGHLGDASGFSSHFAQTRWKLHPQFRAKVSNAPGMHPESSHPEFIPGAPRSVAQTPRSTGAGDRITGIKQTTSNYHQQNNNSLNIMCPLLCCKFSQVWFEGGLSQMANASSAQCKVSKAFYLENSSEWKSSKKCSNR